MGLVVAQYVGSSQTGVQTCALASTGRFLVTGPPGKSDSNSILLSPTLVNLILGVDLLRSWCYKGFHTGAISDSAPVVSDAARIQGTALPQPLPLPP